MVNKKIIEYVEQNIFPIYDEHIKCHGVEHIEYVIRRSLEFAKTVKDQPINFDMVYVVAAYHDIGIMNDRATHEIIGAQIMMDDKNLDGFFTPEQKQVMKEAIEDHRASSKYEPRTIYGKIVSSADRRTCIDDGLRVCYRIRLNQAPESTLDEIVDDIIKYIPTKYGENGYGRGKTWFNDEEFYKHADEITELTKDRVKFKERVMRANNI